jgi:gas vesicle protein
MNSRKPLVQAAVWSALIGGGVGFGLALLIAPDEGRQVRRRLGYLLDRWTHQVAQLADNLARQQDSGVARQNGDALVEDARQRAEQILSDANALMKEVRQQRTA